MSRKKPDYLSVADFARKRGINPDTVYVWIQRQVEEDRGFRVHRFGKMILIEELQSTTK